MAHDDRKGGCEIHITIHSQGDVNIYNCTMPPAPSRPDGHECPPAPVSPGACVPLALGAKPKQAQARKIEKLLAGTRVPSAFAAAFLHLARRFVAGQAAATPLETEVFDRLRGLSPELRRILRCALEQFDALPGADRVRLFDTQALGDPTAPLDAQPLAGILGLEVARRASELAFEDPDCLTETPGKIRVFDPGGEELFDTQVRICRVNTLRTAHFKPPLAAGEYTLDELQQQCVPSVVNGELQVDCTVQTAGCPGHAAPDGACLRVIEVPAGQSVRLQGVNYFSVDATVHMRPKASGAPPRIVDAHVCGDQDTPVTEIVNGETRLINDCRVHDHLTFRVPDDLPPGLYEFQVAVPNITGIAGLGSELLSAVEYLAVTPPLTARFRIEAQKLIAHAETSPAFFGSDEVGIRFLTAGLKADGTWCEIRHVEALLDDVDSGDERTLSCVLLPEQDQPLSAVSIAIIGYEIDNYPAYLAQVQGFLDAYVFILKKIWKPELAFVALGGAFAAAGAPLVVVAIAVAIVLAVNAIIALWAPADLIIQDIVGLSASQLAALTSDEFPAPVPAQYTTASDIDVRVNPVSKGGGEYVEGRDYRCSDEDSRYEIRLRYTRTA